ncbi:trans-sulfuration enzyme family protein [Abyssisolibacter fermentans]|uniref:trans-sulfuration enzyme family protein n=1 Tax=Abyssisolibacter fermentans TaxID=1766203 RepID=UPI00083538CB|nr:aminotransferase class I/II-fold pyridoxal phosphate-dependent enzyme [Abyssisolibacter fermentans]
MNFEEIKPNTSAVYIGEIQRNDITPEAPPIYQTSSYTMENLDMLYERYDDNGFTYTRLSNPNRTGLADAISYIENGKYTLCFSSCMGAISVGLLSVLKSGDHVIANSKLYGETIILLSQVLNDYNIEATFVDFDNFEEVKAAIKPNTKLLYTEILSNPLVSITDIRKIVEIAKIANIKVMVDNTFTTPYLIKPLDYGVDIVVNSVTKALNGHFDVTGGVLTTNSKELFERGETLITLIGSTMDPNSAWLALRGIRTAPIRIREQNKNASDIAKALSKHPKIRKVFHPSLETHEGHLLANELFQKDMYGSILSIEIDDSMELMNKFISNLELVKYANTLGGYRTTVSHPCSSSHLAIDDEERRAIGIHPGILRISCGIEDSQDLIKDFISALDKL